MLKNLISLALQHLGRRYLGFLICFLAIVFAYYFVFYSGFESRCSDCGSGSDWLPEFRRGDSGHDPYVFLLLFREYSGILPWVLSKCIAVFLLVFPVTAFYVGLLLIKFKGDDTFKFRWSKKEPSEEEEEERNSRYYR